MANHIYNISETRSLPSVIDTSAIVTLMQNYLVSHGWRVKDLTASSLRATKQGLHVNFKPKLTITVHNDLTNQLTIVQIRSFASIKIVTGLVVGVVTYGASTALGLALYAHQAVTAKKFVHHLFDQIQFVVNAPQTLLVRRGFAGRSSSSSHSAPKANLVVSNFNQPQYLVMTGPSVPQGQIQPLQVSPVGASPIFPPAVVLASGNTSSAV